MKRLKVTIAVLLVGIMGLYMQLTAFAVDSPLQVSVTDVKVGSTTVTVKVSLKEAATLDAFQFWIGYDESVLAIEGEESYGYVQQFLDTYKTAYAVADCNAKDGKVMFAGANPEATDCSGGLAMITFKILKDTSTAIESLTNLTFHVEKIVKNGSQVPVSQDETYSIKVISDTTPSKRGDVDGNGDTDLDDVNKALKGALTIIKLSPEEFTRADLDGNNDITLDDVQTILKIALTIIE